MQAFSKFGMEQFYVGNQALCCVEVVSAPWTKQFLNQYNRPQESLM
jgi:hypothetical protein